MGDKSVDSLLIGIMEGEFDIAQAKTQLRELVMAKLPKKRYCEEHKENENAYLCYMAREQECNLCKSNNSANTIITETTKAIEVLFK